MPETRLVDGENLLGPADYTREVLRDHLELMVDGITKELLASARALPLRDLTCEERVAYLHEQLVCPTPEPVPTATIEPAPESP